MSFYPWTGNIDIFLKYFVNIRFVQSLHGSSSVNAVNYEVNWWNLGSNFRTEPALGWYYVTFFIAIFLILRYSKLIVKYLILLRSTKIKKNISKSTYSYNFIYRKISANNKKVKFIDFEIKDAVNALFSKERAKDMCSNRHIEDYKHQLNVDMKKMLGQTLQKNTIKLKTFIINSLMSEIREISSKHNQSSITEEYTKKILDDILNLKKQ